MIGSIFIVNQALQSLNRSTVREMNQAASAAAYEVRAESRRAVAQVRHASFVAQTRAQEACHIDIYA